MDPIAIRDSIEAVLALPSADAQLVAPLARAYAGACAALRLRLRRCAEHLDRGMILEAVHLSQVSPALSSLVRALELPNLAGWNQLCVQHGQPPVPPIDSTILQRLSSAAALVAQLDPLLTRHHLAALSRAPVKDRIAVLRHLRSQNPDNPSWAEQLRALEPQRIEELRSLVAQLPQMNSHLQVRSLLDELRSSHWITAIDDSWIRSAGKRYRELAEAAAIAKLPLEQLREAYDSRSYDRCAALLIEWQRVVYQEAPAIPEEMIAEARKISRLFATESRRRIYERNQRPS